MKQDGHCSFKKDEKGWTRNVDRLKKIKAFAGDAAMHMKKDAVTLHKIHM